jgi:polyferredoxin
MNPFGIIQAVLALFEGVSHAADPRRQKERERRKRRFLFIYIILMLLGVGAVIWTIRSLYFSQ